MMAEPVKRAEIRGPKRLWNWLVGEAVSAGGGVGGGVPGGLRDSWEVLVVAVDS